MRVNFNTNEANPRDIDAYDEQVIPAQLDSGEVRLRAGANTIKVKVVGQNPKSESVFVGLDFLVFLPLAPVREGEISLAGTLQPGSLQAMSEEVSKINLLSKNFTLPSGKSGAITPNKVKSVILNDKTFVHLEGEIENLEPQNFDLMGRNVTVVGTDSGSGQVLVAHEIIVATQP